MDFLRRAWVEIDLNALKSNYKTICSQCKSKVIPVIKADAYGHGASQVASALQESGADFFAVSNISEAIELRKSGIKGEILILGYTPVEAVNLLREYNIIQCIYSYEYASQVNDEAEKLGVMIKSHLKLDTGMGRIGFDCREGKYIEAELIGALKLEHLDFKGVFTHFPSADSYEESDIEFTRCQYEIFNNTVEKLEKEGFGFEMKHCCNSAGFYCFEDMHLDAVRAGIILYGLSPSDEIELSDGYIPVMSMYSAVSMVKTVEKDETVSYGRTYKAESKRKVATVSAGYADGVPRLLSNKGYVLINGQKAPIIGRVCMDQFCVDVTELDNISVGDKVEIFGKNISVNQVAKIAQTINYEIICGISKRVLRIDI